MRIRTVAFSVLFMLFGVLGVQLITPLLTRTVTEADPRAVSFDPAYIPRRATALELISISGYLVVTVYTLLRNFGNEPTSKTTAIVGQLCLLVLMVFELKSPLRNSGMASIIFPFLIFGPSTWLFGANFFKKPGIKPHPSGKPFS